MRPFVVPFEAWAIRCGKPAATDRLEGCERGDRRYTPAVSPSRKTAAPSSKRKPAGVGAPMPKDKPAEATADKPRLVLFDGHGIIHRAYHAFPEPLTVRAHGRGRDGGLRLREHAAHRARPAQADARRRRARPARQDVPPREGRDVQGDTHRRARRPEVAVRARARAGRGVQHPDLHGGRLRGGRRARHAGEAGRRGGHRDVHRHARQRHGAARARRPREAVHDAPVPARHRRLQRGRRARALRHRAARRCPTSRA